MIAGFPVYAADVTNSTAPRVTNEQMLANITGTEIVKHVTPAGKILRWAVLTTKSGFAVTGQPSASVSPENDNRHMGEQIAVQNAHSQMWVLMGYELACKLHEQRAQVAKN